ncbi:MAG: Smr/MutS family protein [Geopsychrobacter sp.]|nr:Smr/MutS family protein [Geopsychrobacter sp.]
MSKKKRSPRKSEKSPDKSCVNNPFTTLKGFAVSEQQEEPIPTPASPPVQKERSFDDEMNFLGVDRLAESKEIVSAPPDKPQEKNVPSSELNDQESFLAALGPLDVCFNDEFPQDVKPAVPRRFKQLKKGHLAPDASLDLHGLQRQQVAGKIAFFLQNATYQGWRTLLIVTGRGLHSVDGEPVLRDEAERYLAAEGKALVAEWGRAPRQYGGAGALVIFLKKTIQEHNDGD